MKLFIYLSLSVALNQTREYNPFTIITTPTIVKNTNEDPRINKNKHIPASVSIAPIQSVKYPMAKLDNNDHIPLPRQKNVRILMKKSSGLIINTIPDMISINPKI